MSAYISYDKVVFHICYLVKRQKLEAEYDIYMCSNEWCTFNVKVKRFDGHTEKERNQRAQSLLKRHEKTCTRNHQAGKRFKRTINKHGKEQGLFVSREKFGSGIETGFKSESLDN